ncbi:MAG: polyphenol oxidase family protein [Thermoanaerobaculia bacterium]
MDGQPTTRTTSTGTVQPLSLGVIRAFAAGFTRGALTARSLDPDAVGRGLAEALGAPDAEVVRLTQVHGHAVLPFEAPARKRAYALLGEGDALLTNRPGVLLAVASADCVPVVLADPENGWIAAAHAGWRGTAARVLDAVLDALAARGVRLGNLFAAFGPSISRDRYEVGPEVVAMLRDAYRGVDVPSEAVREGQGDCHFVDVAAFNEAALRARGVGAERIATRGLCTAGTPDLPSWRRDGAGAGRILTVIVRL